MALRCALPSHARVVLLAAALAGCGGRYRGSDGATGGSHLTFSDVSGYNGDQTPLADAATGAAYKLDPYHFLINLSTGTRYLGITVPPSELTEGNTLSAESVTVEVLYSEHSPGVGREWQARAGTLTFSKVNAPKPGDITVKVEGLRFAPVGGVGGQATGTFHIDGRIAAVVSTPP